MSKAYLTIDDSPSKITPAMMDYLCEKGIVPVMNYIGENIETNFEEALYAIKRGAIIGNHSYTHVHFSELTLKECREEIRRTEETIDHAYKCAGVEREHKVFRFPFGDRGGDKQEALQKMLREEFEFERLDSTEVPFPFWKENRLDTDTDMMWSFDFIEYQLAWDNGFTYESILDRIHDKNPTQGGPLLQEGAMHVMLMHDHEATNECLPEYYRKLVDYVMEQGVEFVTPKFLKSE